MQTLGNSKRRHFPTFGDGWRQMASNGVNRRRMASVGVTWRQRRQIGVHGAKLASSSLNWRHRRQIDVIVAKLASSSPNWCQRRQIGVSVANLASLTLFNTMWHFFFKSWVTSHIGVASGRQIFSDFIVQARFKDLGTVILYHLYVHQSIDCFLL